MSSVPGDAFAAGIPISAAKLNKKTITYSTNIPAEPAIPGQVFYAISNLDPYRKNDIVARNIDDDGFTVISQSRHRHNADTNQAGGKLTDIFRYNTGQSLLLSGNIAFSAYISNSYGSTGTTQTQDSPSGSTKLDTSTTANNYRVAQIWGVSLSLAAPALYQTMMQFHGNTTNQFVRWGMNMESMDLTNNVNPKFGVESCSASNSNWNIVTADGTTRTAIDAQASLDAAATIPTPHSFVLDYLPGSYVNFYFDNNIVVSKTTNLPLTSAAANTIPRNNLCNYGVKTTDTNSKQLYIWGVAIVGDTKDSAWKQRI
jgi:hypothetical protein